MEFEARDSTLSRVGVQHFHIFVGPEEVNLFNLPGMDYAGPLYSLVFDNPEQAGTKWIQLVNSFIEDYFDEEDYDEVIDEVVEHAEESVLSFEVNVCGWSVSLEECWGCVPAHSN